MPKTNIHITLRRTDDMMLSDHFSYLDTFAEHDSLYDKLAPFISRYCELLNYPLLHPYTAAGSEKYARLQGFIEGYIAAKGWRLNLDDKTETVVGYNFELVFDIPYKYT